MQSFFSALTWASMGLLVPCVAALFYLLLRALISIGQEWQLRQQSNKTITQIKALETDLFRNDFAEYQNQLASLRGEDSLQLSSCLSTIVDNNASKSQKERELGEFALQGEAELFTPRMLIRLGPSLGLIGTLIPMGPALAGLANGDLVSLSQNMQVAFSTTVLGVLVGAIGFLLYQSRKQRLARSMHLLEFVFNYVQEIKGNETHK